MGKILTLEQSEITQFAIQYAKARSDKRKANDEMLRLRSELGRRGYDTYGVSFKVRAEALEKKKAKSRGRK
jgi:hypothetical protein